MGRRGRPGKQNAFAYDGLGRRIAITNTPADGGSAVTTAYLWCGERVCQARKPTNATMTRGPPIIPAGVSAGYQNTTLVNLAPLIDN